MDTEGSGFKINSGESFIEKIAERLGATTNVKTAYGDPVERNGVTVIPVSKVRLGFGGGAGSSEESGAGQGGGGGAMVTPVGYIELRDGESVFRRIWDPKAITSLVLAGGILVLCLLRRIDKMIWD